MLKNRWKLSVTARDSESPLTESVSLNNHLRCLSQREERGRDGEKIVN